MVYTSNTNLAPYVPDKIPRHTEYQKQFKPWQPMAPAPQDLLMENAKRDIKAKYMVKTKVRRNLMDVDILMCSGGKSDS